MNSFRTDFEKHIMVKHLIRQKEKMYVDAIFEHWADDEIKPVYFELKALQDLLNVLEDRVVFVTRAA